MTLLLCLLTIHFAGDFLLQWDWLAINKSRDWFALAIHVTIYSLCFVHYGWIFMALTFWMHFATDAVTSRLTTYLYLRQRRHWFFVAIGADQLIHAWTLGLTAQWLKL